MLFNELSSNIEFRVAVFVVPKSNLRCSLPEGSARATNALVLLKPSCQSPKFSSSGVFQMGEPSG